MSNSKTSRGDKGYGAARKRNLPSWMSSKEEENDDGEISQQPRKHGKSMKDQSGALLVESKGEEEPASANSLGSLDFSKLMEGIVFVLSGFVNPGRGVLRAQMLEMGTEYQPDWNSNCTLLVCAFPNTPKFRQVEADGGTIISKDWISECYNQRKLADIETYLLNAGKPWRRLSISHETSRCITHETSQEIKQSTSRKPLKQEEKGLHSKKPSVTSKMKGCFSPSKVKKWAVDDFNRTLSWLENQDEKPDPSEINNIAAEGILTCLQDAIDSLKQGLDIQRIAEQWACVPRCVKELAEIDGTIDNKVSVTKEDLCREAMMCKQIYELEFLNLEHTVNLKTNPPTYGNKKAGTGKKSFARDDPYYDSDATIEMTEEEIDVAFNTIASTL